jgi:hypothetical protein
MSLQVSNLKHNNALVGLSIDEQIKVKGGILLIGNRYEIDLKKYAEGKSNISLSGDIVTFTPLSQPFISTSYKNGKQVDANGKEIILLV